MKILAIDTSCDETSVAITEGRKVLSNVIYSQVLLHKQWGGVVPSIAKRAHQERIDWVIGEACRKYSRISENSLGSELAKSRAQTSTSLMNFTDSVMSQIDYIAVTYGPGLAIALEVGINKAKELAKKYNKKLIAVGHMEGHIYSAFGQNSQGKPEREMKFPYLCLLVSGGHTELVLLKDHITYEILGETLDDAAGEALDKAAKLLGLGYPGGPVIDRLAEEVENKDFYHFTRPMLKHSDFNFSFSGLKTAFYYSVRQMDERSRNINIRQLASSYQEAVFDHILRKTEKAIQKTGVSRLVLGGGVSANKYLRKRLRNLTKKYKGEVIFPHYKYLCTDNAAMIGIAAHHHVLKGDFVKDLDKLDRIPRLKLS